MRAPTHLNSQWLATSRAYEIQSIVRAAWSEYAGVGHQPHNPRFKREYSDGPHWGNVTVTAPDGERETFRVHLDCEREAEFYAEHQERS